MSQPEVQFFAHLQSRLENEPPPHGPDWWVAYVSVVTLHRESRKLKRDRDQPSLIPAWKLAFKYLKGGGHLTDLDADAVLKNQLKFFLTGQFGEPVAAKVFSESRERKHPDHDFTGKRDINTKDLPWLKVESRKDLESTSKGHCEPTARQSNLRSL